MKKILAATLLFVLGFTNWGYGLTIDFESLHPGYETSYINIPAGYNGFNWSFYFRGMTSQYRPGTGYEYGTTGTMTAYTSGHKHVSMSSSDGETFTFIGADITAAWIANEPVTVEGWRQGELIYAETIYTSPDGPYRFDFYYHDIDTVWFKPITESGNHHIVIDNITVEFVNINDQIDQLDFDTATLDDIIAIFGEPMKYHWSGQIYTKDNLPDVYIVQYPDEFGIVMVRGAINEIRFESPAAGYIFQDQIYVGSSLETVLSTIGQPVETVTGQPCGWQDGVLYKDINGIAGYCYYLRSDQNVRLFFWDYKVTALYVLGNSNEPSTPLTVAVNHINQSIAKKVESLQTTYNALQKDQAVYDSLQEILESGDYGDLKKGEIIQAMQKIHSAIQHLEQSVNALEKSIQKLEDALSALGVEQLES